MHLSANRQALLFLSVAALFMSAPTRADVQPYGCGVNPAGSLTVQGEGLLGETLVFAVDDPTGASASGALPLLVVSTAADVAAPCGTLVPGWGLGGGSGELLVSLAAPNPVLVTPGGSWDGAPVEVGVGLPATAAFVGVELFAQAALVDGSGGIGLTEARRVTVESTCGPLACISILASERSVVTDAYGFDWEYDDGEVDAAATTSIGAWQAAAEVDLVDWWGFAVGSGSATQASSLSDAGVGSSIDVSASAAGNHFHESVFSDGDFSVTFAVAERVRFDLDASAQLSLGLFDASVQLKQGATSLFYLGTSQNLSAEGAARGWLQAGTYTLTARIGVAAGSSQSGPDAQAGSLLLDLVFAAVADYDVDGDVDALDADLFESAWDAGDDGADVNGDGAVDAVDASLFDAAWQAAQG